MNRSMTATLAKTVAKTLATTSVTVTLLALGSALATGCYDNRAPNGGTANGGGPGGSTLSITDIPGHEGLGVDGRTKQGPRTMPAEVYLRSYLMLFGDVSPADVATAAKGADKNELFESWRAHLGAIGLPDYGADLARAQETNALMLASYERLGIVLCDRAVERDLRGTPTKRPVFDFALATDPLARADFDTRFDSVHRTFLGYGAKVAPAGRSDRFFDLYSKVVQRHQAEAAGATSRFSPAEAGWAVVCYGLVRHPEFHLY